MLLKGLECPEKLPLVVQTWRGTAEPLWVGQSVPIAPARESRRQVGKEHSVVHWELLKINGRAEQLIWNIWKWTNPFTNSSKFF